MMPVQVAISGQQRRVKANLNKGGGYKVSCSSRKREPPKKNRPIAVAGVYKMLQLADALCENATLKKRDL